MHLIQCSLILLHYFLVFVVHSPLTPLFILFLSVFLSQFGTDMSFIHLIYQDTWIHEYSDEHTKHMPAFIDPVLPRDSRHEGKYLTSRN